MVDKLVKHIAKEIEKDIGKSNSKKIKMVAEKLRRKEMAMKRRGLYK
jgi:hypothetical protein